MKILITVDTEDEDLAPNSPRTAYRMVNWPACPNEGENVYPFIVEDDVDKTVFRVHHFFARGYTVINTDPFEATNLALLLSKEPRVWVISTKENPITEREAAKFLLSNR
jgi:hypothetical protein